MIINLFLTIKKKKKKERKQNTLQCKTLLCFKKNDIVLLNQSSYMLATNFSKLFKK